MGANQSSKSASPKLSDNIGSNQRPTKGSVSLRRSMGSMWNGRWKQQRVVASNLDSGGSLHSRPASDSYYVSVPTRKNNYVSLQQQQQQQQQVVGVSKRPTLGQLEQAMLAAAANNGGVYGSGSGSKIATTATTSGKTYAPMETNSVRDGSFEQDHQMQSQQHQLQHKASRSPPQQAIQTNNSNHHHNNHHHHQSQLQQQPQQQQQQQQRHHPSTPFHLSRAVNTKTSCVLNNSNAVAMPNISQHHNTRSLGNQNGGSHLANNSPLTNGGQVSYLRPQQQELPVDHLFSSVGGVGGADDVENRLANSTFQAQPLYQQYHHHQFQSPHQQYHQHHHQQQQQQQQQYLNATLDFHQPHHSYTFSGSRTLESGKKKAPGALASLFQNTSTTNKTPNNHQRQQSNTIHLAQRRNKSASSGQRSAPGSLKRLKPVGSLSGHQATYEAMRTIDMYLIRQIARSCMDFEMEQKIELEIRLRELAAQSLLEASSELDVLEVEKSLLTSDQRMNCYAALLEQQRKQLSNPSLSTDSGRGSKTGGGHRLRADVIGEPPSSATAAATGAQTGGSPITSYSSLSNSQSPSKLSPVSGESTNSPSSMSSHRSQRTGALRLSSSHQTLSAKQRAKNKQREQLMQSITSLSNINCNMVVEQRASLSVSELRIPLMWRDVDHFKGRGDYKRYAVFCLLRLDSQIYDTQLISDVDRQVTDVTFDELVVFNEVQRDFELQLEVYSCVYYEQFSLSSTPRKLKEKLTSSVSKAMGRRLARHTASANYTKELRAYDKSYRFAKIAHAKLRLEDASDSVKTYDLVLVSPAAHNRVASSGLYDHHSQQSSSSSPEHKEAERNTLPLFGHFCCKLCARPDVFDKTIKSGYLRLALISVPPEESGDSPKTDTATAATGASPASVDWQTKLRCSLAASSKMATLSMAQAQLHWGLLRNFALHLWPVDERQLDAALQRGELPHLELPRKPSLVLPVDRYTRLLRVSNSSLTLDTERGCFVLAAYSADSQVADETSHWLRAIEQLIYDSHIWGSVLNHYPRSSSGFGSSGDTSTNRRLSTHSGAGRHYYGNVLQADL